MDRGELVPDKVTVDMVMAVLARPENAKGALLDGFPRTIPQAQALDAALTTTFKSGIGTVIYVKVETDELLNRLSGRWDVSDRWRDLPRNNAAAQTRYDVRSLRRDTDPTRR